MIRVVMALSTLKETYSETVCKAEKKDRFKDWEDKYLYQLEPLVFYLMNKYPKERIEIIPLRTSEAEKKKAIKIETESKPVNGFLSKLGVKPKKKYLDYGELSPREFLEKNITIKAAELGKEDWGKFYDEVPTINPNDQQSIKNSIMWISNHLKKDFNKKEDKLWIDLHGGLRDISIITSALLSLLRLYGIEAQRIVNVEYNNRIAYLRDASGIFKMYDFISGMDEFNLSGSADRMLKLQESDPNMMDTNLLNSIKEISNATKLCDTNTYIGGLKKLRTSIHEIKNKKEVGKYSDIFIDYFESDFGKLLKDNFTVLDIVERCKNKGMYQQALTFIESKMPETIVDNRILFSTTKEDDLDKERKSQNLYDNNQEFIVNNYCFAVFTSKDYSRGEKISYSKVLKLPSIPGRNMEFKPICKGKVDVASDVNPEHYNTLLNFLYYQNALKSYRNDVNHAREADRLPFDVLDEALERYIGWGRFLLKSVKSYKRPDYYMMKIKGSKPTNKGKPKVMGTITREGRKSEEVYISGEDVTENMDTDSGKEIKVCIINENSKPIQCKPYEGE